MKPNLRRAAVDALRCMDHMLAFGEWYTPQERADALREALDHQCGWYQDAYGEELWQTSCGKYTNLDDWPSATGNKFCFNCGHPVFEHPAEEPTGEEKE